MGGGSRPVIPPMGDRPTMSTSDGTSDKDKAIDRSGWTAIGQVASSVDKSSGGTGSGGPPRDGPMSKLPPPTTIDKKGEVRKEVVVPRTEFVIFFVWAEPVLEFTPAPKE